VLGVDPLLAPRLAAHPGLRVPGAWDPFELAVRAILGQQISVAGARTLAGRLVERLGEPLSGDETTGPTHLFPTPRALANADLTGLGLTGARVRALTGLGQAVADDPSLLDPTAEPGRARDRLLALPGIGPWTVDYIALRAFRDPDAFPEADLGLLRALEGQGPWGEGRPSARQLRDRAEAWRPWRAYAALHLWTDP
jgi:AraC family transcriptional regulator of adaptative response / DNA-3-methyladenine glycosylase II